MWNQNLRWERIQWKRLQHTGLNVSLWNRAAWAQPLASSHCFALLLHILLLSNRSCPAMGQCSALPIRNQLSVRYLLVLLLLSYRSAPHWALPDDTCQWGTTGKVIQSRDSGAFVIWLLPLGTLSCLFVCFLFGNVFLVDWASWVTLLSIRVELSPTILVEETFMTVLALICNFIETVYRPWGNRLRIHQILGSLKLIWVAKTSNLFLITFIHVKCLLLSFLSLSRTPNWKRVFERRND